jgi:hypothetical protein
MIKRQREQVIKERGKVAHYDLPDMRQELMTQAHQEFKDKMGV